MIESYFVHLEDPVTANVGPCDSDHVTRSGWSYVFFTSQPKARFIQVRGTPTDAPVPPKPNDQPVSSGGEGWLVNAVQHKVVQFKPDTPATHAEWVILRTFHWRPPDYPIPQTRRRILRHNAIEA